MIKEVGLFWVLSFAMSVFVGSCHATENVALYSKSTDVDNDLKGRWSPDCDNLEGMQIDDHLNAEFTINSNQIVISSTLKKIDEKDEVVGVYFKTPLDLGRGGMNLDWDHFSKITRIADIKIKGKADISLNWAGFYSNKTKKYEWINRPDFYENNGNINFHRCEN